MLNNTVFRNFSALPMVVVFFLLANLPLHAFPFYDLGWIQDQLQGIENAALEINSRATFLQTGALLILDTETDPDVINDANQILAGTNQMEADATGIADLASELNDRIDNSEVTMLRLSADILAMAAQIGLMADRILLTELQIGEMADRIMESEYLISDSTLELARIMQQSLTEVLGFTQTILSLNTSLVDAM